MEIFKANKQWSTRPADERFNTLHEMYLASKKYADEAVEKTAEFKDLRVEKVGEDVQLVGRQGIPAKLTNWAFGQLCQKVGAPASYLRTLPATLAAQNLNHGLAQRVANEANEALANLMFHQNGGWLLRSCLTDAYSRIWNYEILERLLVMEGQGWAPARPTSHWGSDTVGQCIMCAGSGEPGTFQKEQFEGTEICVYCKGTGKELPALYASDHDMFAFLMNSELGIKETGAAGMIYKGVIVENSEVGAKSVKMTKFGFREMCGNHIIWGATDVVEIRVRHVGDIHSQMEAYYAAIRKYANESVSEIEGKIEYSKNKLIADTKEEVLDALFGKRSLDISRKTLEEGYDAVKPEQDGDPRTVWGFVQGLTRFSQTLGFADKRNELDRKAGKILDLF
jgi:hypothetical protein